MAHEMSVQAEAGLILIADYLQSLPLIAEALGVKAK